MGFEHRPTNSVKDRIDSLAPTASGNLAVDRTETVNTGFGDDELLETLDRIPILGLLELTKILFFAFVVHLCVNDTNLKRRQCYL